MNKEIINKILKELQTKQQGDEVSTEIITQLQSTLTQEYVSSSSYFSSKLLTAHLTILHLTAPQPPYSDVELKNMLKLFQTIFMKKFNETSLNQKSNQKTLLKMIEIYEFIETTKILLFLFDIDNDKCLQFIKILIERYLLLKVENEKLCDLIKKIIETMYRESANGEEKKITQMFISIFDSISLPFYENG